MSDQMKTVLDAMFNGYLVLEGPEDTPENQETLKWFAEGCRRRQVPVIFGCMLPGFYQSYIRFGLVDHLILSGSPLRPLNSEGIKRLAAYHTDHACFAEVLDTRPVVLTSSWGIFLNLSAVEVHSEWGLSRFIRDTLADPAFTAEPRSRYTVSPVPPPPSCPKCDPDSDVDSVICASNC